MIKFKKMYRLYGILAIAALVFFSVQVHSQCTIQCIDGYQLKLSMSSAQVWFPALNAQADVIELPCTLENWQWLYRCISHTHSPFIDDTLEQLLLLLYVGLPDSSYERDVISSALWRKLCKDPSQIEEFIAIAQRYDAYTTRDKRSVANMMKEFGLLTNPITNRLPLGGVDLADGSAMSLSRMQMSTTARYVAVVNKKNGVIYIWDLQTHQLDMRITTICNAMPIEEGIKNPKPLALAWSKDDRYLAVAFDNGLIDILDSTLRPWESIKEFGYTAAIHALDWHPDNAHLIGGTCYGEIIIWDVTTGKALEQRQLAKKEYKKGANARYIELPKEISVAWSSDGKKWAATTTEGMLFIVDWETNECIKTRLFHQELHEGKPYTKTCCTHRLVWGPTNEYIAIVSECETMLLYDCRNNGFLHAIKNEYSRDFSGNDQNLVYITDVFDASWVDAHTLVWTNDEDSRCIFFNVLTNQLLSRTLSHEYIGFVRCKEGMVRSINLGGYSVEYDISTLLEQSKNLLTFPQELIIRLLNIESKKEWWMPSVIRNDMRLLQLLETVPACIKDMLYPCNTYWGQFHHTKNAMRLRFNVPSDRMILGCIAGGACACYLGFTLLQRMRQSAALS
jgi:WD40 repeat protein